ncbi:IPExxxVDY family protein [Flavobacterium sp.]|uniref:IPExxxVDY family protein n=1 Tax=Flavobacterium sp. TaxID=239 RepID=UPI0025D49AF7|nr:IPExxxVDY family protein [Flavobacterium sp.]
MAIVHKLFSDEEEKKAYEKIDYQLIAIHSTLEDYRLAYYINQNLPINLQKGNYNIQISNKEGETQFTRFVFEDSKDIAWNLVQNQNDVFVPSQNSNQGLFAESNNKFSTKIYLIPEFKKVDYFLKIGNGDVKIDVSSITNCIKKIDRVSTVYNVEVEKIKSKNNLIF